MSALFELDVLKLEALQASDDVCWQLCREVYRQQGIELPEFNCPDHPEKSLLHVLVQQGKPMFEQLKSPEPWCLVLFRMDDGYSRHMGVVLGNRVDFIHASKVTGVTISRLSSPKWSYRIEGYYAWPGR